MPRAVEPRLGQRRIGDVRARDLQRLADQRRVAALARGRGRRRATRPSPARARAAPYLRAPMPASRTASTGTSYSRRSDGAEGCGLRGRQRAWRERLAGEPLHHDHRRRAVLAAQRPRREAGRVLGEQREDAHSRSACASWSATNSLRTSRSPMVTAVGGRLHRATVAAVASTHASHHLRRTRQDRAPPGSPAGRGGARGHLRRSATPTTSPTSRRPAPPRSSPRWRTPTPPR